jgi:low affinity Fe/Cu permease
MKVVVGSIVGLVLAVGAVAIWSTYGPVATDADVALASFIGAGGVIAGAIFGALAEN